VALYGFTVATPYDDEQMHDGMTDKGKLKYLEITATSSTTYPIWTATLGLNPGLWGKKPVTNHLWAMVRFPHSKFIASFRNIGRSEVTKTDITDIWIMILGRKWSMSKDIKKSYLRFTETYKKYFCQGSWLQNSINLCHTMQDTRFSWQWRFKLRSSGLWCHGVVVANQHFAGPWGTAQSSESFVSYHNTT